MPPKKQAAAAAGGEEDHSTDYFMKYYRQHCKSLEIPVNPRMKEMYEKYVEEGEAITKVSYWLFNFFICENLLVRFMYGKKLAGKE